MSLPYIDDWCTRPKPTGAARELPGFRSGLEKVVCEKLANDNVEFAFEKTKIEWEDTSLQNIHTGCAFY